MRWILRILGILCVIAALLCLDDSRFFPWRWGSSLWILGFLFFYLAELLRRFAELDLMFKPSKMTDMDPIKTDVETCEGLRHVEGQATCAGCGKVAPKRDLCYSRSLDAYYHRECLARDLNWGNQS